MRQGNKFCQWVERDENYAAILRLPLELEDAWIGYSSVLWIDNGDGTYTLDPEQKTLEKLRENE